MKNYKFSVDIWVAGEDEDDAESKLMETLESDYDMEVIGYECKGQGWFEEDGKGNVIDRRTGKVVYKEVVQ